MSNRDAVDDFGTEFEWPDEGDTVTVQLDDRIERVVVEGFEKDGSGDFVWFTDSRGERYWDYTRDLIEYRPITGFDLALA